MHARHLKSHSIFKMVILVVVGALLVQDSDTYGAMRAAIATRQVTPDPLLPVSGGIGFSRPTTRKLGDLTVRALVLEQDATRVAICSVDFLGFPAVLSDKVRVRVAAIPPANILIGATHTHSAPDCYGFPDQTGKAHVDLTYLDFVCTQLADAIKQAVGTLQPVTIKIATAAIQGKVAYNAYAERLYDPRCHILQALDHQGRAIATLVNKEDWNSCERYNYISRTCLGEHTGSIFVEKALAFTQSCPRPQ